jgi:hypothetical protein
MASETMAKAASGHGKVGRHARWVLGLWLAVAALYLLAGCVGRVSFANDPRPNPRPEELHYPTTYPEATPGPGEVVLRWNGALLTAFDLPATQPAVTAAR